MKNKNVKTAKKAQEKTVSNKFPLSEKQMIWGSKAIFFLFSIFFLGIYNSELLFKLQNSNFFLQNSEFFDTAMQQSSGLLMYVSGFLTQLLYYPLLGALFAALLLSAIELLVCHLFKIPSKYFILSFLPSALILLTQTSIGYAVYDRFDSFLFYSFPIGTICTLLLFLLYSRISKFRFGTILSIIAAIITYPIIGIYASFAILCIMVDILTKERTIKTYIYFIISALVIGILPYISSIYHTEKYADVIFSPLANPHFLNLFILTIITLSLLAFYPLICKIINNDTVQARRNAINIIGFAIMILGIFYFSFRDENFRTELKMQRLTELHQWDEALKIANEIEEPTKAIAAYRMIALANKNILARDIFKYPCQLKKSVSQYLTDQPIYYEDLFIYSAFTNNAYLWSMEFWVTTGETYEHLKKMALCALLNDEPALAKRYIGLLKQTLFQSKWAEEYEQYIGHPEKLYNKYPEFKTVNMALPVQDKIIELDPLSKVYLNYDKLSLINIERRILADLYRKDMNIFMNDIIKSQVLYKDGMPDCIKEALVICAINGNPKILAPFKVERPFALKVADFFNEIRNYSDKETAAEKLKERYGGMYCYYFVFSGTKQNANK